MKKTKIKTKAQIFGQTFIFLLALLVASMILLYGYKAIFGKSGFVSNTEKIALVRFETDISSKIQSIASDYGSVQKLELVVPTKYKEVCLVDWEKTPPSEIRNKYPLIADAWEDNTQNVFLVPMADTPITVSTLTIDDPGYICAAVLGGKVTFRIEGLGDSTKVSAWEINS